VAFHFEGFCLDLERRELSRGAELVAVEPQVFDLIAHLIANRELVVSKDQLLEAVWGGRVVSESTLTSRINAARRAVGDSGAQQRLIRTIARKGFRFVGTVSAPPVLDAEASQPPSRRPSGLHQDIHFCTAADGVRIAYAEVGQGPPIVKAGNWLNHLEYDWESPIWSHLLGNLAQEHRLVRYDARGNGLSDWDVDDISFEAFVRDMESVIAATGLQKFALLGISQGCAVCIEYAVRHPERVTHLVLYGGYAQGRHKRGSTSEVQKADALQVLMREGWGQENPAFRQLFTSH
jgi:DNA-binding winged helix-turn-helix (wHTH) protein